MSRDHVTMTSRDALHTSTTVCPAVMVAGPSMVTLGGGAMRGGRERRNFNCYSESLAIQSAVREAVIVRQL